MNYLLLYFAILSISVNADITTLRLQGNIEDCKNSTGVDQVFIDQAHQGNFINNNGLELYYCCFGDPHGRHVGYLDDKPLKRTYKGDMVVHLANWDLQIFELKDWLVNRLQHSPKTVDDALQTCVYNNYNWRFTINLLRNQVFELSKCLSENGAPVDVVSDNYVDRSVENLNKLHDICKNNHQADQNLINEAQNGNVADSESLGSYYTCYSLNAGFLNMYGRVLYNYLKNWFKLMLKQESDKVDSALDRCYKPEVDQEKLLEDVLQIVKCFADEKLPIDVMAN